MAVSLTIGENAVTAYLAGEIDHHTAKQMREDIDRAVERAEPQILTLDFSGVTFMDSSGIGLIMGRYRLMQSLDGELKVVRIPSQMKRVMKISGLDKLARME